MGLLTVLGEISKQINQIEKERQGKCWVLDYGRGWVRKMVLEVLTVYDKTEAPCLEGNILLDNAAANI